MCCLDHIPAPWDKLHWNEDLKQGLLDLLKLADDLNILEWGDSVGRVLTSARLMQATKTTTSKHIPDYGFQETPMMRRDRSYTM